MYGPLCVASLARIKDICGIVELLARTFDPEVHTLQFLKDVVLLNHFYLVISDIESESSSKLDHLQEYV